MSWAHALFWAGAAVTGYTYAGYPLLVAALARLRPALRQPLLRDADLPDVTVVMAAYNEAARLESKLRNLRQLDYPQQRLRVIVVSDGSTDGTERVAADDPGVRVLRSELRHGKAHALNLALHEVTSDLVVFCDLRQDLDSAAVRRLVSDLQDPRVGAVSGELVHRLGATQAGQSIGLYWRYEKWIRKAESRLYATVGVTGALYAMRRADWRELREGTILDDFETPMQVLRRGGRVLFEPQAQAWDVLQAESAGERRRKVRTLIGNFQSFTANPWLFSPWANPVWWQFLSHKVLRLFVPYALAACLIGSAWAPQMPYRAVFVLQALFYLLAAAGGCWPRARRNRLVSFAQVFCDMNLAAVLALGHFAAGRVDAKWEKTS